MSKFLFPKITHYCAALLKEQAMIPDRRKLQLNQLSAYITKCYQNKQTPQLIVICTHNSRRSHMGQIWLAIGADYFHLPVFNSYSGGTEATAFNKRAVTALDEVGLEVVEGTNLANPVYKLYWSYTMSPYKAFSKKYGDLPNPTTNFGAILVCTEADGGCPIIAGADYRIALPFEDPKAYDETPLETEKYAERCRDIGREMLYVMSRVEGGCC